METFNRTVIASFSALDEARDAVAALKNAGFHDVRLVENQNATVETQSESYASTSSSMSTDHHHENGFFAFFARLFGMDDNDKVEKRGWAPNSESYFRDAYQQKRQLVIVSKAHDYERAVDILRSCDGTIEEQGSRYFDEERLAAYDTTMDSERVMELREEQLEVGKNRVQTGEVNLRKEIITEVRTVEVPLTREEIVVERRTLDGVPHNGSLSMADMGRTEEIRIPVSEEHVHIEKKVVPREEIRVTKERVTDTEIVSEEVRHEEARIESEGRVRMRNEQDLAGKRKHDTGFNQPSL